MGLKCAMFVPDFGLTYIRIFFICVRTTRLVQHSKMNNTEFKKKKNHELRNNFLKFLLLKKKIIICIKAFSIKIYIGIV